MAGQRRSAPPSRAKLLPMLATTAPAQARWPAGPAWTFEPKYDGIRIVAVIADEPPQVLLLTRNGIDKRGQFPEVAEALARVPTKRRGEPHSPIILDGELVALDEEGQPARFQALQSRMHATRQIDRRRRHTRSALILFDCLSDGSARGDTLDLSLAQLPWSDRRRRLEAFYRRTMRRLGLAEFGDIVRLGETSADGETMLQRAQERRWEGLIAKRIDSRYHAGERTRDWLKLKIEGRGEFVVGGWTEPERSRQGFGALLLGQYDEDGALRYVGRVGTGFSHAQLRDYFTRLQALRRQTSPFARGPAPPRSGVHWVDPTLVVDVKYTEWTTEGQLRHPAFIGMRDDSSDPPPLRLLTRLREIEESPDGSGTLLLRAGESLPLTHLGRPIVEGSRVTKGALLRYYTLVAPVLLPAIADRPLVLERHHAQGKRFHQQQAPAKVPPGVRVDDAGGEGKRRFIAGNLATLLYIVQLGAISIDPWHSRLGSLDAPDYTIVDLDPGPGARFAAVIDCARWVHDELEALGLVAVPKTSGASGMHVVVPLPRQANWEAARLLAELIATRVAQRHPERATVIRSVSARPRRSIYVDYLQNIRGKSVASVYSARHTPTATVSTPLSWDEVVPGLDPRAFTIETVPQRIRDLGDLWGPVMRQGNTLDSIR